MLDTLFKLLLGQTSFPITNS